MPLESTCFFLTRMQTSMHSALLLRGNLCSIDIFERTLNPEHLKTFVS